MKILADVGPVYSAQLTGVGYYTDELLKHLSELVEVNGYAFNFRGKKSIKLNYSVKEQRILPGKLLTYPRYLKIDLPLSLFFRMSDYDVVLGTNFLVPPCGNTPVITTVHDLGFVDHPEWAQSRNAHILQTMLPKTLKRSKALITISEFSAQRIKEIYNYKKPIIVIDIPPKKSAEKPIKPKNKLIVPGRYFLFVSTIEPRKNISTLLDAFESLPENIQSTHTLVLAGKPGWDPKVLARLREGKNQNIIYLDYVSEAERNWLYSNSAVTVVPSHYEGFGMTILESLDAGSPVVVSDIPPHREILGSTGDYFKPLDSKKLADLLCNFTKLDYRNRAYIKQRAVLSRYSWDNTAAKVLDFIRNNI